MAPRHDVLPFGLFVPVQCSATGFASAIRVQDLSTHIANMNLDGLRLGNLPTVIQAQTLFLKTDDLGKGSEHQSNPKGQHAHKEGREDPFESPYDEKPNTRENA